MTTYVYRLTLNDSECIMMEAALKLMIKHCTEKLAQGEGAPNWAHKNSAEKVLSKLYSDTNQNSGNNFG